MRLKVWLDIEEMSIPKFAKKIGKHHSLVHKYINGEVKPSDKTMREIYRVTRKAVDASDFYGLSDQIFEEELAKRKGVIQIPEIDFRYGYF